MASASLAQVPLECRPNLKAIPAFDISLEENTAGQLELRLSAETWNSGPAPLELIAGEVSRGQQNVYQRNYCPDGSYTDRLAGEFVWHQGHGHFHFEDYALYTLQPIKGKSKRTSSKTTFCLRDTDLVDGSVPGAPSSPVYDQCGNFFQGMSPGWGDTYASYLAGQAINVDRLKDGDYRLMIEADPKDRLVEVDETDNSSCVLLRLSVSARTVEILNGQTCDPDDSGPPGSGDVVVNSISPDIGQAGAEDLAVTILGSGFADGMGLSFENGSGSKPEVTQLVVDNPGQISAMVTIHRRGKPSADNVWDVRVGSGVLVDGFTVLP